MQMLLFLLPLAMNKYLLSVFFCLKTVLKLAYITQQVEFFSLVLVLSDCHILVFIHIFLFQSVFQKNLVLKGTREKS